MKFIPILILSIFLQGCALFKKSDIPPVVVNRVHLDSEMIQLCAPLKEDLVINTFEDSLVAYGDLATAYGVCAKKQKNNVIILKQFAGE